MTTWTGTASTISAGQTAGVSTALATYRDAIKAASEAWTTYGTGASWTASTTNPVLNNGTWVGRYAQVNKLVDFSVRITMGSTTTFGSGFYRVALPVAVNSNFPTHFNCFYTDTSTGNLYVGTTSLISSTVVTLASIAATVAAVSPTAPFTWANTDILEVWGRYEAA